MKHKHALYPITMSACALLCFVAVLLVFANAVQPLWGRILVLALPSLLLGVLAFFAAKGKLNASATSVWTTVLSIILVCASLFYICLLFIWTATTKTTDVRYYSRAYAQIEDIRGVKEVFPKTIPADAEDITFMYWPQFLQGGEVFELSYTTTDERIAQLTAILKSEADWIGFNQQWYSENNRLFDGIHATRYQLFWDGGSNHGRMCYVLVNEETGQITFSTNAW